MDTTQGNPFNELYVTETVAPEDFVQLFSPVLIRHALPLFQPGNVVVKGVQGSGKSMLMNLLKPEIRIAYEKANEPLPLPPGLTRFVGAGINFIRSAAIDFGQRATDADSTKDMRKLPHYFADFFNYWIVYDILRSLEMLTRECGGKLGKDLGLRRTSGLLDAFAARLSTDPCWFGYLAGVRNYDQLQGRIQDRIGIYRRFLNFALDSLPEELKSSTTPVGEPISRATECLWDCGIVPRNV